MPVFMSLPRLINQPGGYGEGIHRKKINQIGAGGHYLAAGGKTLALEGEPPKRVVLHISNSIVKRWWDSAASKDLRELGARCGKV